MTNQERAILSIAEVAAGRPLVERPAAGKAPTAFRIWAYGPNNVDGKTVVFSERSAEALIAEQTARGRLYSFDFDHRSLMPDVTPAAGAASGWHVLEVREHEGKPELWVTSCEWTTEARDGLESDPPMWRYFSPCYETDPETREVLSHVNCALTNNPRTYGIPALASAAGALATASASRLFELHRDDDESGVSGTGIVAEGTVFSDGTVALRWRTETSSTTLFDNVEQVVAVHGHSGKTRLVYLDEARASASASGACVAPVAEATQTPTLAPKPSHSLAIAHLALRALQVRSKRI